MRQQLLQNLSCVVFVFHTPHIIFFPSQGPVAVKVQVPNMQDKTEWKLNGQILNFTVPLTDQVFCHTRMTLPFHRIDARVLNVQR